MLNALSHAECDYVRRPATAGHTRRPAAVRADPRKARRELKLPSDATAGKFVRVTLPKGFPRGSPEQACEFYAPVPPGPGPWARFPPNVNVGYVFPQMYFVVFGGILFCCGLRNRVIVTSGSFR